MSDVYAILDGVPVDEETYHTLKALDTPEGQKIIREEIDREIIAELINLALGNVSIKNVVA